MLQIIFFGIVVGIAIAIAYLKESKIERIAKAANTVYSVFDGPAEVMYKIVRGILQCAPIGVFALMGYVVARYGPGVLGPLVVVVIALYVSLFIHIVVVYGGILSAFKLNLIKFLRGAKEAMLTAFVTRSSSASSNLYNIRSKCIRNPINDLTTIDYGTNSCPSLYRNR